MPPDELATIHRFFRPLAGEGSFGLRDDAARISVPAGCELVVTADMLAAGVHFLPGDPPETVGQKALRVNLSDLAAKGARAAGYLLSIGLAEDTDEAWLAGFAEGLRLDQRAFGINLLGGDTIAVSGGPIVAITAFGLTPQGRMVHRFGGRPGDALYVSGTIGAAAAGLAILKQAAGPWDGFSTAAPEALVARYRVPEPRTVLAPALLAHASAAMDISDGLVGDCDKLASASDCSAEIWAEAVPIPEGLPVESDGALLAMLITGGDDYEILAAVLPGEEAGFRAAAGAAGVPVARIGALREGHAPTEVRLHGRPLPLNRRAYVHGRR